MSPRHTRRLLRIRFSVANNCMWLAVGALATLSVASATAGPGGLGDVVLSTGAYTQSVPIEVPPFHGLEPKLAVSYSSQGGNGFAGVGWSLSGFSVIEAKRSVSGAVESYSLDGQELWPCQVGSASPSCADESNSSAEGTHSTKIESYLKIRFDSAANKWTVWGKDGTRTLFSPTHVYGGFTVRWGQEKTIDTYGNTVNYGWELAAGDYYPSTVAYNGYVINIYRETRPDKLSFAAGWNLWKTEYRLRSVIVQLGATPIRGYKLTYDTGLVTGRSLLASIRQYGKDLTHTSGAIGGGTALPPQIFTYQPDTDGKKFLAPAPPPPTPSTTEPVTWTNRVGASAVGTGNSLYKSSGGSFDAGASSTRAILAGNGYVESTAHFGTTLVGLSNGDSNALFEDVDFGWYQSGDYIYVYENGAYITGGWGVSEGDVLRVEVMAEHVRYVRNNVVLYTSAKSPVYPLLVDTNLGYTGNQINNVFISGTLIDVANWCGNQLMTGDFNGDGRTDQLCYGPVAQTRVRLATATGFALPTIWLSNYAYNNLFLGDFNGDGKTDIADYGSDSAGNFLVGLSTGSGFTSPAFWGNSGVMPGINGNPGGICNGSSAVGTGDFNGDGDDDVYCKKSGNNNYFVGLSNGTSFAFNIWAYSACNGPLGTGDFNGDAKTDLSCVIPETSTFTTFLSMGNAFAGGPYKGGCSIGDYVPADLNGDGLTDVTCRGNGDVALSTGLAFDLQGSYGGWCHSGPSLVGDFDGDGKAELACNSNGNNIEVRKWEVNALSTVQTWISNWCGSGTGAGDFNGDGKTDLFCPSYANPVAVAGTGGKRVDLMATAANGLGGTSQVSYVPTTNFANTNNPGSSPVVTGVTIGDGRDGWSTTTYAYAGGKVSRSEHRPLGFASAIATLPCVAGESNCPSTETSFMQDLNSAGKLAVVLQRDQLGRALTQKTYEYTTNGTVPRTSLLTGAWTYTFGNSGEGCSPYPCGSAKRTFQSYEYGAQGGQYGNVTRKSFSGDFDAPGNETFVTYSYRPNTAAYIVDRVAEQKNYGTSLAALVKSQAFGYDGQSTDLPPTKGSVTTSLDWLNTGSGEWVTTAMAYDSFGNLTTTTDPTAHGITTAFDPTYHVFPISVTITGTTESEETTWDPVCSLPTQRTDVRGQVTTMQSDALCRPTTTAGPLGSFTTRSYVDFGTVASQRTRVESPSPDGAGNDYTLAYFDGLGRVYRSVKKGPAPAQDMFVDSSYDARGRVASRTAPYYENDPAQTTTFNYDALGRPIATTYPGAAVISQSYGVWSSDVADEHAALLVPNPDLLHVTRTRFDAYGREITKEQHLSGQTLQTQSTYDAMGRLVGMTDPAGNSWSWTYDWLGRNIVRSDPDSGTWSFEYDDAGRMTAQIDAKNQRTEFEYVDPAGRLTRKGDVTIIRSEPRAGYFNTGQVTTISSPGTTLKTDYDALGRPVHQVRTIDGVDYGAQRRYDAGGRLRGITYPDGDAVGTTADPLVYDGAGRLKTIPGMTSQMLYDAAGHAISQSNVNGTTTTRTFSAQRGFLTHISTMGLDPIQDVAYTPDPAGLITEVASPFANEAWTYAYDDLHRLTTAVSTSDAAENQAFAYDVVGNITSNSRIGAYTYPPPESPLPHAPSTVAGDAMTYDANGNLIAGRGRSIQWNSDNLPVQINTTVFTYDGLGGRLKKTSPGATTLYPFGDDYEIANGVITKYINVEGIGVVAKRVGSQTFWLHTDRLGSIQVITDQTGTDVQHRTYRPYGDKIADTSAHTESRGYIGEKQDEDTGLTYLHARYYDATLGTFLSPDPLHPAHSGVGLNRYAYGFGDPVNRTDPYGLAAPIVCGTVEDRVGCSESIVVDAPWPLIYLTDERFNRRPADPFDRGLDPLDRRLETGDPLLLQPGEEILSAVTPGVIETIIAGTGTVAASCVPGVGECMDLAVIADKNSSTGAVIVATISLAVSTLAATLAPNYGALKFTTKPLPGLDASGKVHGRLPEAQDLVRYSPDELLHFAQDLEQSVQERIRRTIELGPDRAHGQRQADEQYLLRQIRRRLGGQ